MSGTVSRLFWKTNSEHAAGYRPKPPASRRWRRRCGKSLCGTIMAIKYAGTSLAPPSNRTRMDICIRTRGRTYRKKLSPEVRGIWDGKSYPQLSESKLVCTFRRTTELFILGSGTWKLGRFTRSIIIFQPGRKIGTNNLDKVFAPIKQPPQD